MSHERIRTFDTADTYPDQRLSNDLAQAVVAEPGQMVFLRGQVGQDLDTGADVGVGDPAAQAERAMANIALLLGECGSGLDEITKITTYLTDIRFREDVYRVMGRWLRGVHYVSTGLVVSALARPAWLVEIDATAVIPARRAGEAAARRAAAGRTAAPRGAVDARPPVSPAPRAPGDAGPSAAPAPRSSGGGT